MTYSGKWAPSVASARGRAQRQRHDRLLAMKPDRAESTAVDLAWRDMADREDEVHDREAEEE